MKIYIGFSRPIKFMVGAALISWWTERPYSHSYVRFEYADSKAAVFHAAHGMVHFLSWENFSSVNQPVREYEIELSPEDHSLFFDDCMNLSGQKYSVVELCQIFAADIAYKFGKEIHTEDKRGYICSELMGWFCVNTLGLNFAKSLYLLTPGDVDDKLNQCSYKLIAYNK